MANNVFNQFLMHSLNNGKANEGMPAIKLIAWLLYDVNMLGVWAYALNITFQDHVAVIEKALLCIASLVFFAFRIRSLHLDNQKKEIDNWERRNEVNQKRLELQEREHKLKSKR